ncbi:MAG: protein phosphatase 2C domain-containing protein [bacterium]|nr:protein phosphatase 2C domain-containing protein [bacterium]
MGEFAGQTRFLTMGDVWSDATSIMNRVKFAIADEFTALVLMTDGVSDPVFETESNLRRLELWDRLWGDLQASASLNSDNPNLEQDLLSWLNFWTPGNHDDRTIAILF